MICYYYNEGIEPPHTCHWIQRVETPDDWLLLRWNPSAYRAEAQHTERRLFRSSLKGTFAHLHTTLNKSRDEKLFHTGAGAVNASGVLFLLRLETVEGS